MNQRVTNFKPDSSNYTLQITLDNDDVRIFDVRPYLDKGLYKGLKDEKIFNSVKPFLGSIQWSNELDFCPDTLYLDSIKA